MKTRPQKPGSVDKTEGTQAQKLRELKHIVIDNSKKYFMIYIYNDNNILSALIKRFKQGCDSNIFQLYRFKCF